MARTVRSTRSAAASGPWSTGTPGWSTYRSPSTSPALADTVRYAHDHDHDALAAAGNSAINGKPAALPGVVPGTSAATPATNGAWKQVTSPGHTRRAEQVGSGRDDHDARSGDGRVAT